ncbi:MAG: alpha-amylase family glycosyl hydrolase, partial [Candidatus Angelobacter sp.]
AYSNRSGDDRALVVFNNRYSSTSGWIRMSSAYVEKSLAGGRHLRQRTLGESLGLLGRLGMYAACRDAITGLEYLYRAGDIVERGLHLELHAYQCHTFLEWRDLREDPAHPWGQLCDTLAGQGVSSLEDALRDLQLRPVCNAFRELIAPNVAEALAKCEEGGSAEAKSKQRSATLILIRKRAEKLLNELSRYLASQIVPAVSESGRLATPELAISALSDRVQAAMVLQELSAKAHVRRSAEAGTVLTVLAANSVGVWSTILAWCALGALGILLDPHETEAAAVRLFDAIRLRGTLAEAFGECGVEGEERWRAAARIRACFAHASHSSAPYSWIHDPDVAWVIGVHQHEGMSYVVKEEFEKWLWWMEFPKLLKAADKERPAAEEIVALQQEIGMRMEILAGAGFRIESLDDSMAPPGMEKEKQQGNKSD